MIESDLFALLRGKYQAEAYAVFPQVRRRTGAHATRTADAVVMSLWPSRGLELMGFELKARRGDWLRELKIPQKTEESIFRFCDRWYIVADKKVVEDGELPPTWGLMVVHGRGLRIVKKAPRLKPEPFDRNFIASLLRNARNMFTSDPALKKEYKRGLANAKKRYESYAETDKQRAEKLEKTIVEFQKKSGIHVSTWNAGDIGDAVRAVMERDKAVVRTKYLLEQTTEALRKQESMLKGIVGVLEGEDE